MNVGYHTRHVPDHGAAITIPAAWAITRTTSSVPEARKGPDRS